MVVFLFRIIVEVEIVLVTIEQMSLSLSYVTLKTSTLLFRLVDSNFGCEDYSEAWIRHKDIVLLEILKNEKAYK